MYRGSLRVSPRQADVAADLEALAQFRQDQKQVQDRSKQTSGRSRTPPRGGQIITATNGTSSVSGPPLSYDRDSHEDGSSPFKSSFSSSGALDWVTMVGLDLSQCILFSDNIDLLEREVLYCTVLHCAVYARIQIFIYFTNDQLYSLTLNPVIEMILI